MTKKPIVSANRLILTSLAVDLTDVILNFIVAFITHSAVMAAEAIQGLADLISAGFVYIGLKRSELPPDEEYQFGYGRELYVWALFAAIITFFGVAGLTFYFGWYRFWNPQPIENLGYAYGMLVVSIVTNGYALSLSVRRLRQGHPNLKLAFSHSPLIETRTTFVLDSAGTLSAVVGLVAMLIYALTGDVRFDGLGAMIIGILVAIFALILIFNAKDLLSGRSSQPQLEARIRNHALSFSEVNSVVGLRTVNLGVNQLLVNLNIHVKDGLTTDEIEALLDNIKARVKRYVPEAGHIQIELDTPDSA